MKAVIFDCDGVLVNSTALSIDVMKNAFNKLGLDYSPEVEEDKFAGLTSDQRHAIIREDYKTHYGKDVPKGFFTDLYNSYRESINKSLQPMPGVKTLLQALKDAGIPIAVASNGDRKYTASKLRQVGLYDFFQGHIYCRDDVTDPKPAPDLYQYAAKQLGYKAEDCVIVEDSQVGAMAGAKAGGHVIGYIGDHCRVKDMDERLKKAGASEVHRDVNVIRERLFKLYRRSGPGQRPPNRFGPHL